MQVQCLQQGTQSWCSGTTQTGRVGRDVGRGETHEYLWLINVNVWQKSSQCYKVIILQLKLINFLKKIARHETNIQNSIIFLYTSNEKF